MATAETDAQVAAEVTGGPGAYRELAASLRRNPVAVISLGVLLVLGVLVAGADIIAPYPPNAVDYSAVLAPPSAEHWFGTDHLGRDLFSRILYGGRVSLLVGITSLVTGLVVGGALGVLAGFYRVLDNPIMRLVDVLMSFPYILRAIAVVAILGPGLINTTIAVGIGSIPVFARLVRAAVLSVREQPYFESGRAIGATDLMLIRRYVVPNILPTIIVYGTLQFGQAVLSVSTLSYLGLGVSPPTAEWGQMVNTGRPYIFIAPWMVFFPCLFVFITVLCLNTLGDALRDTLDPRLRRLR